MKNISLKVARVALDSAISFYFKLFHVPKPQSLNLTDVEWLNFVKKQEWKVSGIYIIIYSVHDKCMLR